MSRPLGTIAALVATASLLAALAVAALAAEPEPTREAYVAQVEPICKANREANSRIMAGAQERVNRNQLEPAGKQFIRLSQSVGRLATKIAAVPPPAADSHRVSRWLVSIRLLRTRLRNVGKYFKEDLKIKGIHESILAERAGLSANNTSIVFHFKDCRFNRIGK
jgi:hypothetical protein